MLVSEWNHKSEEQLIADCVESVVVIVLNKQFLPFYGQKRLTFFVGYFGMPPSSDAFWLFRQFLLLFCL